MAERNIPGSGYSSKTKNKILDESTKLFAVKGFGSVSIRDIAKAVGIKESTIYNYYESKAALFEDIMSRFEKGYRHYIEWLKAENMRAESLEELMDNMFNREFVEMLDPIGCMGISLTLKEQHNIESARKRVFELFHQYSIESMKTDFDRLIDKGIIPRCNTKMISMILMYCVLVTNDMRIHEYFGLESSVNYPEMFSNLKKFITNALRQGDETEI